MKRNRARSVRPNEMTQRVLVPNCNPDKPGITGPIKAWREVTQHIYDREEARRDGVERQAMTLLGTTGVVASLYSGVGAILLQNAHRNYLEFTLFLGVIFTVILVSLLVSVLFALRALRRIPIHLLLPEEAMMHVGDTEDVYYCRISTLLVEITNKNYLKTDFKVDNLKRAQRAFCVGLAFILVAGIGTIAFGLLLVLYPPV